MIFGKRVLDKLLFHRYSPAFQNQLATNTFHDRPLLQHRILSQYEPRIVLEGDWLDLVGLLLAEEHRL